MNEAELLFSQLFSCSRLSLYLNSGKVPPKEYSQEASRILKKRIWGEPLQYILGNTEFMGLEIKVDRNVLIPRPETETLVETALKYLARLRKDARNPRILDLGTGSGCIALSLARLCPACSIDASDISEEALEVAKANAALHKLKINFIRSDLFASRRIKLAGYDLIVSNPPYVPGAEINRLQIELSYEPRLALDGGIDGLDFYRRLILKAPGYLRKKGLLAMEIGCGQDKGIEKIFYKSAKFEIIELIKDLNNINRVVVAKKVD